MRNVNVAAIQMKCSKDIMINLNKAEELIRKASLNKAEVILLPELFEHEYFCQERQYDYYKYAKSVNDNDAVKLAVKLSKELNVVLIISFYEKDGLSLYNSVAVIENGNILGVYRKTHIPDDHFYQEKFYFTPGNTGFKVFETSKGVLGVGICWDQWFSETARCLALNGAELIFFPTAIGSEPILEVDSSLHWQRCMQGHSACNITPVIAANRIGKEEVNPSELNSNQCSSLEFYGFSFICDETGEIVAQASKDKEEIIYATFDLDKINDKRLSWGLYRDRRPKMYKKIVE